MSRSDITRLLTAYGFSPVKALEVAIDNERGDEHAFSIIAIIKKGAPAPSLET